VNSGLQRTARSDGVAVARDGTRIAYSLQGSGPRRVALVHASPIDAPAPPMNSPARR